MVRGRYALEPVVPCGQPGPQRYVMFLAVEGGVQNELVAVFLKHVGRSARPSGRPKAHRFEATAATQDLVKPGEKRGDWFGSIVVRTKCGGGWLALTNVVKAFCGNHSSPALWHGGLR